MHTRARRSAAAISLPTRKIVLITVFLQQTIGEAWEIVSFFFFFGKRSAHKVFRNRLNINWETRGFALSIIYTIEVQNALIRRVGWVRKKSNLAEEFVNAALREPSDLWKSPSLYRKCLS